MFSARAFGFLRVLVPVLLVFVFAAPALARDYESGRKNNDPSITMTDFHVRVKSTVAAITVNTATLKFPGGMSTGVVTNNGTMEVTIDFFGLNVPPGSSIGYKVNYTGGGAVVGFFTTWTAVASDQESSGLSANVTPGGDITLRNDQNRQVNVQEAQYTVQPTGIPGTDDDIAQMMKDIADGAPFNPGWTPLPPGNIPPLSDTPVLATIPPLAAGEILLVYFRTEFSDGGVPHVGFTIHEIDVESSAVPSSSALGVSILAALLFIALFCCALRIRPIRA